MINSLRLNQIPLEGPIVFFRSCMTTTQYPHVHVDSVRLLERLGYTVHVVREQTCCAGFSFFGGLTDEKPLVLSNARNMALFASYANDVVTVCNACFATLNLYQRVMEKQPELAVEVHKKLRKYRMSLPEKPLKVWHLLELLYAVKAKFPNPSPKKLGRIKAAVHTGCHFLRPNPAIALDSAISPRFFESLVARIGAKVVTYKEADLCCGGGWTTRHTDREISLAVSLQKLKSIHRTKATHILVSCPFCLNVLENAQVELEATGELEKILPVWHVSQLGLLALGVSSSAPVVR
ncbi:MAG: heterodisulfide reductase-related iron-sulfur binding cluster [Candidatus Ranarchaeia archaeon]